MAPLKPSSELAAHIQWWIYELQIDAPGAWPVRVCKEELNALPLHSNLIYLWAIQPDGTVLCMDHEAFAHPTEPETDPFTLYAVLAQGIRRYPQLEEILPAPPEGTHRCRSCNGTGLQEEQSEKETYQTSCSGCNGLGWNRTARPSTAK